MNRNAATHLKEASCVSQHHSAYASVSAALLGGCATETPKPVVARHRPAHTPPGEAQQASYPPAAPSVAGKSIVQPTGQAADCLPAPGINAAQEDDLFRRFDQTRAQGVDDATVAR